MTAGHEASKTLKSHYALRLVSYLAIWVAYLAFMASHAPRGIDWLGWHFAALFTTWCSTSRSWYAVRQSVER